MRVVIDTNVLISATFWTGRPKKLLNQVRRGHLILLTSDALLLEFRTILTREDKPFKLTEDEAEKLVSSVEDLAEKVRTSSKLVICRHAADNRVLECALDGGADRIISGDGHLLEMMSVQGIRIVTVVDFLSTHNSDPD